MRRNIVWCGSVLAAAIVALPLLAHAQSPAGAPSRSYVALVAVAERSVGEASAERAVPAPAADADPVAPYAPAADHFVWSAPILAVIGLALAWLLVRTGPIV